MTKKGARNFSAPLLRFQVHLFNVVDSSKEVANKMRDDIHRWLKYIQILCSVYIP